MKEEKLHRTYSKHPVCDELRKETPHLRQLLSIHHFSHTVKGGGRVDVASLVSNVQYILAGIGIKMDVTKGPRPGQFASDVYLPGSARKWTPAEIEALGGHCVESDCGALGVKAVDQYLVCDCEHARKKDTCKECKGSRICKHARQKAECKQCKGSAICKHARRKAQCKVCKGSAICQHAWVQLRFTVEEGGGEEKGLERRSQREQRSRLEIAEKPSGVLLTL